MKESIALLFTLVILISGCQLPVNVKDTPPSEAEENAETVTELIESINPETATIWTNGSISRRNIDVFYIEDIYFVDGDSFRKYNLGEMISVSASNSSLDIRF